MAPETPAMTKLLVWRLGKLNAPKVLGSDLWITFIFVRDRAKQFPNSSSL